MTDLAKLVVKLEAETAKYQKELESAKKQLASFSAFSSQSFDKLKTGALIASTAIAGALTALTASAIKTADDFAQMAQRTGESAETLSGMAYAAKLANVSIEDLDKSLVKLQKAQIEASKGTGDQAKAFEAIGVSVKNADGSLKSTENLMLDIADAFSKFKDGAGKTAVALEIFGKSGAKLIPFLNQGKAGIKELMAEAARLGLIISTDTAKAADEFGDNLDRLKAAASGVGLKIAETILPELVKLTNTFVDLVKNGDSVSRFAEQVVTGLKIIVDIAYSVYSTFDNIGSAIGALGAAAVAFAQGDFARAKSIIVEANQDQLDAEQRQNDFLEKLWSDRGVLAKKANDPVIEGIDKTIAALDALLKKEIEFGGKTSELTEVRITAKRLELTAMEQFEEEMRDMTATTSQKAIAEYHKQKAALDDVFASGKKSAEDYNARLAEIQDELLPEVQITAKRMTDEHKKNVDERSEYEKQAARNTQDIIAGTLKSGFDDGIEGITRAFADMLLDLASQALAANLANKIFGDPKKGGGGGWLDIVVGAVGSMFGGGAGAGAAAVRDNGGPGRAGAAYMIGRGAQPEMFVPDSPGRFIPAQQMMGAPNVTVKPQILNVRDPNEIPTAMQSGKGEAAILNIIGRNPSTIRNLLQG